ncbi:uncharacterized protein G2W53_026446 [Senna tora]|uniref:Uncharacterized protein n=1 Tax=Senna tora TaxID=362788 RepID=A0A834TH71_9FABA|nr:uncharacterized protein G2W53_026446 [Senna tora]
MGGVWIMSSHIPDNKSRSDVRNFHELQGKRLVANVIETSRFALYLQTGGVLMLQLESSWHGRIVDHVLTYSEQEIAVGSQKPSRITRQKTCCASELNTSIRFVFANRSGFDAPIGVVMAWEERGSCLIIFRRTNQGRITETFTNYEAKNLLHKVVMLWEERGSCINIFQRRYRSRISETRRFTMYLRTGVVLMLSGFDAPIGVIMAWEERGSGLNIFRMTNRGRISENFMNYEAKDLLRK